MEYKYYFGTYDSSIQLNMEHREQTTTGEVVIPRNITLRPWELKHVTDFTEGVSTTSSTIGIPDKPSECVYIYDTGGPIRTFTISGTRYDNEEQVSNLDFMHTQFNKQVDSSAKYSPFSNVITPEVAYYCIGIEWLTSTMQATMKGYVFRRICDSPNGDGRVPVKKLPNGQYGEEINVGLTAFNYSFDNENPGIMNYSLTFTERKAYENGPIYREYIPSVEKV